MATRNKAAQCFPFASFHSRVPAYCDEFKLLHTFGRRGRGKTGEVHKRDESKVPTQPKKTKGAPTNRELIFFCHLHGEKLVILFE